MIEIMKLIIGKINFKHVVTLIVLPYAFQLFHDVIFKNIAPNADKYVVPIIELMKALSYLAVGFWLGSSYSSQKKDAVISNMTQPTQPTPPAPSSITDRLPQDKNDINQNS